MRRQALLASILTLGLGLRAWGMFWGLYDADVSRRPHPDEWTIYWLFHWFTANGNLDPCPNAKTACFLDWGTLYPYIAYAVHWLLLPLQALTPAHSFGPQADTEFVWTVIAGRTTSLVLSTLTIFVVYKLAARAYDEQTGLVAAGITSVSALLIQLAHFGTPDSTTIFLLTCTLYLIVRATEAPDIKVFALAGLLLGLSIGSEYHMVLLAIPLCVAWWGNTENRNPRFLAVAAVAALAAYAVSNVYALVHISSFISATEHTLRIRTVDSSVQYGDRWAAFGPAWLYVIRFPLGYGVGFALAGAMLAGTVWAIIRRTGSDWVLLAWLFAYFMLVTLSPAKFMRYSAPLLPVLAAFTGRAVCDLLRARAMSIARGGLALVTAVAIVTLAYDAAYDGLFSVTDSRLAAAQWVTRHAPPSTRIQFEQLPNGLINLPYFFDGGRYQPCFSEFQSSRLADGARYVLTDSYDLEEHPRILQADVTAFRSTLARDKALRIALTVHHVPELLGWQFPIDGSPHDWRYPSHVITVYASAGNASAVGPSCYPSLAAAHAALYPAQ